MSAHPPLRLGKRRPADSTEPQCPAVTMPEGDRCACLAEPLHDWHSASGVDPHDGEPYGVTWRSLPALLPGSSA